MKKLLVVTDLDGSLLNHDDYSFSAATEALARIKSLEIPLILASSKTRREMQRIQTQLNISDPFICENGSAICTPDAADCWVEALAPSRDTVLAALADLRSAHGYRFTGFADSSIEEIAAMTGLSAGEAALAAERDYTEPLLWQDTKERLARFVGQLERESLQVIQGGRFLSVCGDSNKGAALQRLREYYGGAESTRVIALGDSPNDKSLLDAADIAVVIMSGRSDAVRPCGPAKIVRTEKPGPAGWQAAMSALLDENALLTGEH